MPRGQPTDVQTKLNAIADLDEGHAPDQVAARYGVSVETIKAWKLRWDRGESLENQSAGRPPKEAAAPSDEEETTPMSKGGGEYTTSAGTVLPPMPPQQEGATRRVYPDEWKFALGRALLSGEAKYAEVAKHYDLSETLLRGWADAVKDKRLTGPKSLKNGAANRPAPPRAPAPVARAQAEPSTEIVLDRPPAQGVHAAQLLLENEHLRRENKRLKRRLEQALAMVLDHDDDEDGGG